MPEKVRVAEPLGFKRRLFGALLSVPIMLGVIFGWLIITYEPVRSGQMSSTVSMGLFMLLILAVTFMLPLVAYLGRSKVTATPILFVNETVKERQQPLNSNFTGISEL